MPRHVANSMVFWLYIFTAIAFIFVLPFPARSEKNIFPEKTATQPCGSRTDNSTYVISSVCTPDRRLSVKTVDLCNKSGVHTGSGDTPQPRSSHRNLHLQSTETRQRILRLAHLSPTPISHNSTESTGEVRSSVTELGKVQRRPRMSTLSHSNDSKSEDRTVGRAEKDGEKNIYKHNTVNIGPMQNLPSRNGARSTFALILETENPPKDGTHNSSNLKLLALLVLIIPLALLIYGAWRLYKYIRYKQMAKSVNLSGGRRTGLVNDQHMSYLLRGEDSSTERGSINGVSNPGILLPRRDTDPVAVTVKGDVEFDPLANTAAMQKARKAFRRHSETTTKTFSPPEPQGDSIPNTSNTKTFDDNGDDTCSYDNHWDDKRDSRIYATSLTYKLLPYMEGGNPKATAPDGGTAAAVAGVPPPRSHVDLQAYNLTTKVLIDKYANPRSDEDSDDTSRGAREKCDGRIAQTRRQESAAFDSIISAAAEHAPLGSVSDSKVNVGQPLTMDPLVFPPASEKLTTSGSRMKRTEYEDNEA